MEQSYKIKVTEATQTSQITNIRRGRPTDDEYSIRAGVIVKGASWGDWEPTTYDEQIVAPAEGYIFVQTYSARCMMANYIPARVISPEKTTVEFVVTNTHDREVLDLALDTLRSVVSFAKITPDTCCAAWHPSFRALLGGARYCHLPKGHDGMHVLDVTAIESEHLRMFIQSDRRASPEIHAGLCVAGDEPVSGGFEFRVDPTSR